MADNIFTESPCSRASIEPYCQRVKRLVTPRRYRHILRVASLTEAIARANEFSRGDLRAAVLAAILHDVARDLPVRDLLELAPPKTDLEQRHPLSVHGRAGRALAERWGVNDARVLEAIEGHVYGVSRDNPIGMAVYIADVSEPGRGCNAEIRELAMKNLFRAYQRAVDTKVRYLKAKGKDVHPATLQVHREICEFT